MKHLTPLLKDEYNELMHAAEKNCVHHSRAIKIYYEALYAAKADGLSDNEAHSNAMWIALNSIAMRAV